MSSAPISVTPNFVKKRKLDPSPNNKEDCNHSKELSKKTNNSAKDVFSVAYTLDLLRQKGLLGPLKDEAKPNESPLKVVKKCKTLSDELGSDIRHILPSPSAFPPKRSLFQPSFGNQSPKPQMPSRSHLLDSLFSSPGRTNGIAQKTTHTLALSPSGIDHAKPIVENWFSVKLANESLRNGNEVLPPSINVSPNTKITIPKPDNFCVEKEDRKIKRIYSLHRHAFGKTLYPKEGDGFVIFSKNNNNQSTSDLARCADEYQKSASSTNQSPLEFLSSKFPSLKTEDETKE